MTPLVLDVASGVLLAAGGFFVLTGAIGLVRLPDIFTRLHGASLIDTAGAGLMILGMLLQAGFSQAAIKLLLILAIFFFTLPVASHALARAALAEGVKPRLDEDRRGRDAPPPEGDEGG